MTKQKPPLYVLPHGIEVVGEYPARGKNLYWRVRIRPHPFFPDAPVVCNGVYVRRNRVVLASKLGRALTGDDLAHHGDEDRENDSSGNIEATTPAEHNRHHKTGSKHRADSKEKTSATLKSLYASGLMVRDVPRGSATWSAKLTEEQAGSIKHSSEKTRFLVARFGVSRTVVKQIRNGKIWRHIP